MLQNKTTSKSSEENHNPSDASNPPSRLPSLSFEAPSWLRGLFIVAGVAALIFGLFRYGPVLLDALRELARLALRRSVHRKAEETGRRTPRPR